MYYFNLKRINKEIIHILGKERYIFLLTKKADNVLILFNGGDVICNVGLYTENIPEIDNKKVGYIGIINSKKEISQEDKKTILSLAIQYMKNKKVEKIIGPLDRDTWSEYRTKTFSTLNIPFFGEPKEQSSLTYKNLGFTEKYNYISTLSKISKKEETTIENINFRYVSNDTVKNDIEKIYELSISEFEDNLFYGKINKNIFINQYLQMFELLKPTVCLAEKDDEIIGFMLGFPGLNCIENKKCFVMKTIAVKKEYRNKKIGKELFKRVVNKAEESGFTHIIGALIYEENVSNNLVKNYGEEIISRYALMEKNIEEDL